MKTKELPLHCACLSCLRDNCYDKDCPYHGEKAAAFRKDLSIVKDAYPQGMELTALADLGWQEQTSEEDYPSCLCFTKPEFPGGEIRQFHEGGYIVWHSFEQGAT